MCFYFDVPAQPVRIRIGAETPGGWEDGRRGGGTRNKIWSRALSKEGTEKYAGWEGGLELLSE